MTQKKDLWKKMQEKEMDSRRSGRFGRRIVVRLARVRRPKKSKR